MVSKPTNKKKKRKYHINWKAVREDKETVAVLVLIVLCALGLIIGLIGLFTGKIKPGVGGQTIADPNYNASSGVIDKEAYNGTILEETEDAGTAYVDGTLFLGDSNTARFLVYEDTTGKPYVTVNNSIGVVSMGIGALQSLPVEEFVGLGLKTMPQAVALLQPERIILTMGTNNLSGSSTDATNFIKTYREAVLAIVEAYPSVDVIVNAIPPVGMSRAYPNITMTQIDAYNLALVSMCEEEGWKFLDSSEVLKDASTGYAKEGYTISDGLHLSQKGVDALFTYVRTHAYITEDDRPKPLASIPTPLGVPSGLIQGNPLGTPTTEIPNPGNCEGTWDLTLGVCSCNNGSVYTEAYGCYAPVATPTATTPTFDTTTQEGCLAASMYWYGESCHDTPSASPVTIPDPGTCVGTWDGVAGTCICTAGTWDGSTCVVPVVTTPPTTEAPVTTPPATTETPTEVPPAETPSP